MSTRFERQADLERRRLVIERLLTRFSPAKREKISKAVNRGVYRYLVK